MQYLGHRAATAVAATWLLSNIGCGGGQVCPVTSAPSTVPAAAIDAAPPPAASVAIEAPDSSEAPPTEPAVDAPAPSDEPVAEAPAPPPLPSPQILLVDEPPHYAMRTRPPEPAHGHETGRDKKKRGRGGRPYHPAPGIVVNVPDAQGGLAAADLQRVARNLGYWPFRRCYEEGLVRDQRTSGKVSLDVQVAGSGAVEHSSSTGATIRDEIVVACIARETRALTFPAGSSPTNAALDVSLSPGDEPISAPTPIPSADRVREGLRGSWSALKSCYAGELARRADAGGRMELRFRVAATGEVLEVAETGETRFPDVDVTRCVLRVYRTARLPAFEHTSREHSFVYGLHFESKRDQTAAP